MAAATLLLAPLRRLLAQILRLDGKVTAAGRRSVERILYECALILLLSIVVASTKFNIYRVRMCQYAQVFENALLPNSVLVVGAGSELIHLGVISRIALGRG